MPQKKKTALKKMGEIHDTAINYLVNFRNFKPVLQGFPIFLAYFLRKRTTLSWLLLCNRRGIDWPIHYEGRDAR